MAAALARWLGIGLLVAAVAYYLVLASPRAAGVMVLVGVLLLVAGFSGARASSTPGR